MLFRDFFIQSVNLTIILVNFLTFTDHFHQDQFTATITRFQRSTNFIHYFDCKNDRTKL